MLSPSDWLSITGIAVSAIGIVVSALVAIWVVDTLQKKLDRTHQLKDHFSKEVLAVREQYRNLVRDLTGTSQRPKQIVNNFKMTGIYANDLLKLLNTQYRKVTIEAIREFEKKHDRLFNDILMTIYNEQ